MFTARAAGRPTPDVLMTQEGYDRLRSELLTLTTDTRQQIGRASCRERV